MMLRYGEYRSKYVYMIFLVYLMTIDYVEWHRGSWGNVYSPPHCRSGKDVWEFCFPSKISVCKENEPRLHLRGGTDDSRRHTSLQGVCWIPGEIQRYHSSITAHSVV